MNDGNSAGESWRDVPGYEGLYEVSTKGRVRSLPRRVVSGPGRTRMTTERILKQTWGGNTQQSPRYQVSLSRDGVQVHMPVHVLVLTAFVGPRPLGMQACHRNGDELDNRLENLRWDTPAANAADKIAHGRDPHVNQTHCLRSHKFTGRNLRITTRGHRLCVACSRAQGRVYGAWKRHGISLDIQEVSDWYYAKLMSP